MSILSEIIATAKDIIDVARSTATGMSITLAQIPKAKKTVS